MYDHIDGPDHFSNSLVLIMSCLPLFQEGATAGLLAVDVEWITKVGSTKERSFYIKFGTSNFTIILKKSL